MHTGDGPRRSLIPALAGFQRASPWSNAVHVTHAERKAESDIARIKTANDLAIPDGSRSISLARGTFFINLGRGTRCETQGMVVKLWLD